LIWVASFSPNGPEGEKAIRLLAKDHVQSTKLAPLIPRLSQMGVAAAQPLFLAALERSDSREVKGWSSYGLAQAFKKIAEGSPGHEADRANEEAEKYFRDVAEKYGDIKTSRGPLGELARRELYELRNLRTGKPAPEIEGEDVDGKRFKLSDYRGKVVVLDFWGHWWGPCRAMYPHDRALVKKLADRPFVLLGVNSDPDRNALKQVMKDEEITWRSWWDGGNANGPIATQWNVTNWPTFFLIDQGGTIRNKFVGISDEKQFDDAVEALIQEAEKGRNGRSRP
jgi:peroxiredoxin